tara:strand:+ start:1811 stop:4387 length:2577 start_codon:yes stop_codon:yes gene_type:complete
MRDLLLALSQLCIYVAAVPSLSGTTSQATTTTTSTAASSGAHVRPPVDFSSSNGQLYANGQPFIIKGANWYGGEGPGDLPEGLSGPFAHDLDSYMQMLSDSGFNALRIGFNHQAVLDAAPVLHFDADVEPALQGKRYVESLLVIAQAAARHNVLVTLMCGRLTPHDAPGNGLWYNEVVPEEETMRSWTHLARSLCSQWNIFAVDLFDEPHGTTWASTDPATNWHAAAQRIGNHVHSLCAHWLIMVQGSRSVPWESGASPEMTPGENLMGVHQAAITLTDMSKLVYAPHVAPPSEHMISAYQADNFPHNMQAVWGRRFGFVTDLTGKALVLGRFGGLIADELDLTWQQEMLAWMARKKVGMFYDCFNANPTSGGLLHKDWSRMRQEKLNLLADVGGTALSSLPPPPPAGRRARIPPDAEVVAAPPPPPASQELVCLENIHASNLRGALDWEAEITASTTVLSVYTRNWGSQLHEAVMPSEAHTIRQTSKGDRIEITFNQTLCFAAEQASSYELCFEVADLVSFEHVRFENRGCATLEQTSEQQTVRMDDAAILVLSARFAALDEESFVYNSMTMLWIPVGLSAVALSVLAAMVSRRKELAQRCPGAAIAVAQARNRVLLLLSTLAAALRMVELAARLARMTDEHTPLSRREPHLVGDLPTSDQYPDWDAEGQSTPSATSTHDIQMSPVRSAPGEPSRKGAAPNCGSHASAKPAYSLPEPAAPDLLSSIGNILSQSAMLHDGMAQSTSAPAPVTSAPFVAPSIAPPVSIAPPPPAQTQPAVFLSPPPQEPDSWSDIGAPALKPPAPRPEPDDEPDDIDDSETVLSLGPIAAPSAMAGAGDAPDRSRRARPKQKPRDVDFD